MRRLFIVAGLVVSTASTSHAEVAAMASASVGQGRIGVPDDGYESSFALQVDIGTRVLDEAAIGVHVGVGSKAMYSVYEPRTMFDYEFDYSYRPIQLGVSAQLALGSRLSLTPWIGVQNGVHQEECMHTYYPTGPDGVSCTVRDREIDVGKIAAGLSVAIDAYTFDDKSRISLVGSAMGARGSNDDRDVSPYRAVWLGVGYRFWK